MFSQEFKFGKKESVRDKVTGYSGYVTAATCYFYGARENQYLVEFTDTTGRPIEWWVTEDRLIEE